MNIGEVVALAVTKASSVKNFNLDDLAYSFFTSPDLLVARNIVHRRILEY